MADAKRSTHDQLRELTAAFAARLPLRIDALDRAAQRVTADDRDEAVLRAVLPLAHGLAGSAGGFGFPAVTELARSVETLVQAILASGLAPTAAQVDELRALLESLQRAGEERGGPATASFATALALGPLELRRRRDGPGAADKTVVIVEDDAHFAEYLALQLGAFGYRTRTCSQLDAVTSLVEAEAPAVIVMDIVFPEGDLAGARAVAALRSAQPALCPVIFMSLRRDLMARLEAARAGSDGYITKPFDIVELVAKIDRLTASPPADPYRVLIVDHDAHRARWRASALEQADMRVETVGEALAVMEPLVELRPDVVLMTAAMPGYDGLELAAAIRQQEALVGIPILFLSNDSFIAERLISNRLGGEPFLIEPLDTRYLVATVSSLVERARTVHALMTRDSLTGLLNHTRIKEQLDTEVERARRDGTPLSVAMMDIDHFKVVNDSFGHPVGDRVLKGLARLLQRRLRRTDYIGRYGGDEFAVIFPGTEATVAQQLLDPIRAAFAQIREEWPIAVAGEAGFSGGVASLAGHYDGAQLTRAADEALYDAKREGRNRIVLSSSRR